MPNSIYDFKYYINRENLRNWRILITVVIKLIWNGDRVLKTIDDIS